MKLEELIKNLEGVISQPILEAELDKMAIENPNYAKLVWPHLRKSSDKKELLRKMVIDERLMENLELPDNNLQVYYDAPFHQVVSDFRYDKRYKLSEARAYSRIHHLKRKGKPIIRAYVLERDDLPGASIDISVEKQESSIPDDSGQNRNYRRHIGLHTQNTPPVIRHWAIANLIIDLGKYFQSRNIPCCITQFRESFPAGFYP